MVQRLSVALTVAMLGVIAVLHANGSAGVSAQATPPHRFFGSLTISGQPAPVGTVVRALIGTTECGTFTTTTAAFYQVDVAASTQTPGCGRGGENVVIQVNGRAADQSPTFRSGGFERLDLTVGGGATPSPSPTPTPSATPTPAAGFNAASLNLSDPRPCIPARGDTVCDATRTSLWNGEAAAWSDRGITDPDERFRETVIFRVRAADPAVISIIARFLNAPYLQVTFVKFKGTATNQTDEFVEVSNLGGGDQDMTGWTLRSPARSATFNFPQGFVMAAGQVCRVYTGAPQSDSCGNASFNSSDVWPDSSGEVILFYDALALPGADTFYSSDPNNQPPPPNLVGVNTP